MGNNCVLSLFSNMKIVKLLLTSGALLFGFSIICISLYQEHCHSDKSPKSPKNTFLIFGPASAMAEEATPSGEATQSADLITIGTDYYLPYPGILPDHPLYWLKMLRDKIVLSLTSEPQSRFDRLLLYADKRIGAAEVLVKGRKFDLGVSTTLKSENYLEQAVQQLQQLSKNNKATAMMKGQAEGAVAEHRRILEKIKKETNIDQGIIKQMLELNSKIKKEITSLAK